jgi:outer membrane protein assembly factor BamB
MKSSKYCSIFLFTYLAAMPLYSQLADSSWTMYQQNLQYAGQSPYSGPNISKLIWKYHPLYDFSTDPAIGPDGTIYLGSTDGILYAFNPDSTENWRFQTGDKISYAPIFALMRNMTSIESNIGNLSLDYNY